jgi:orotate phosphoribosyltransferase
MNLFQLGSFRLASGLESSYKIECDALTDEDWTCLAYLLFQKLEPFGYVEGVPKGGLLLAEKMQKYRTPGVSTLLLVDDVWTTGGSMVKCRVQYEDSGKVIGAVVFARGPVDRWVTPLFTM